MTRNIITTVNLKAGESVVYTALLEKKRWNDAATIGPLSHRQSLDRDGENDGIYQCRVCLSVIKQLKLKLSVRISRHCSHCFVCLFVCLFPAWSLLTTNQGFSPFIFSLSLFFFFFSFLSFYVLGSSYVIGIKYESQITDQAFISRLLPDYCSGLYIKTFWPTVSLPASIYAYESVCSCVRI